MAKIIRVMVAEDFPLLREDFCDVVSAQSDMEVVTIKTQIKGLLGKFGCSRTKEIVKMIRQMNLEHLFQ